MISGRVLALFGSNPDNPLKHPSIEYAVLGLLLVNISLMIYLAYKLYKLIRSNPWTYFEKRNRRYRIFIFALIFSGLLLRGAFEGDQIYKAVLYDATTHLESYALVIDALPSLLFVSIACAFSYFWYALYSSFDEDEDGVERKRVKFRALLIAVNMTLYTTFIACSVFHLSREGKVFSILMRSMCIAGLIFSTILLKIHGNRLYDRALRLVNYTGRTVKSSSGFRKTYLILLVCCVLKWVKEGVVLYFSVTAGEDLLQDLDYLEEGYYLSIFIAYVIVFYVVGEYGLFLMLIKLLDSYANKSRISFGSQDPKRTSLGSEIMEDEEEAEEVHAAHFGVTTHNSYAGVVIQEENESDHSLKIS